MKFLIVLAVLVVSVILCDKNEDRLPTSIKQIYSVWKKFSHILGIVMSFIILTILWIVGFGIYAIILKIIRLPKQFQKEPDTFWIDTEPSDIDSMKYQF